MKKKISELFREIEGEQDVHQLMKFCLQSLEEAVVNYSGKDLLKDLKKLVKTITETEPKIALVIDNFHRVLDLLFENYNSSNKYNDLEIRNKIVDIIQILLKEAENKEAILCKNGQTVVENGDMILIHSHSRSVTRVLREAYDQGIQFEVIIAEQEFDKTLAILKLIQSKGIPVKVVPEYMLSHIENEITKVFTGIVTLNSQMNFVASAGTHAVISEFHLSKIPIYVFMTTAKMSLWKSHQKHHTYKVKNKRSSELHHIEYERIKFSHDRVPLKYINHIVTEEGIFTPSELEKLYWTKYKEREVWNKEHNWKNL